MQQAAGAGTSDAPPVVDLDSNSVIKARSMGAHVVAPCTHDGLCPMEVGGQGAGGGEGWRCLPREGASPLGGRRELACD